jgi:DNA-binding transcriptional LysR family regulator
MDELGSSALRALLHLARLGTMAAVAEELGYTPGAVSQQIARLETTVGTPLVIKVGRGVRLTDAGRVLVQHAESLLHAEQAALSAARATQTTVTGRIDIGVFGTTAASILAPLVVTGLARDHPGIEVRTYEVEVDDFAVAVRRGRVDVAFGLDYSTAPVPRDPGVEFLRMNTERFSLAVSPTLASTPVINLAQAADWPWILTPAGTYFGQAIRNACRAAGFEPRVVHAITDTSASLSLAAAGHGVTPVTPLMVHLFRASTSHVLALTENIQRHIVLVRHHADRDRPTVQAATAAVKKAVDTLDQHRTTA